MATTGVEYLGQGEALNDTLTSASSGQTADTVRTMARKIITQLVDDLDGTVLEAGEGETVLFSLDGTAYEIDMSSANATILRDTFARYTEAGRRVSAAQSKAQARTARSTRGETAAIREWAASNSYPVSSRGRIPENVVAAYRAAN